LFFRYPIEATEDNWLHVTLGEMIKSVQDSLAADNEIVAWPEIIPVGRGAELRRKHGLRDRWNEFVTVLGKLAEPELDLIFQAWHDQNQIEELVSGAAHCPLIDDLPEDVREPISNLFVFAYELVRDDGIRDKAYKVINKERPSKSCPFCGYNHVSAPEVKGNETDHYLCKEIYPFAAANLRNLVPICHYCNSGYKLNKDLLKADDGAPRRAYDPYCLNPPELTSVFEEFADDGEGYKPRWDVRFEPATEELGTWHSVFDLVSRLKLDVLSDFEAWLRYFTDWSADDTMSGSTIEHCLVAFTRSLQRSDYTGMGFIRRPFFEQLSTLYEDEPRVRTLLDSMVSHARA
jgi:hypothetical protein